MKYYDQPGNIRFLDKWIRPCIPEWNAAKKGEKSQVATSLLVKMDCIFVNESVGKDGDLNYSIVTSPAFCLKKVENSLT